MKKVNHRLLSIILSITILFAYAPMEFSVTAYANTRGNIEFSEPELETTVFYEGPVVDGGDISNIGLDLIKVTPTDITSYTAGNGTVLWNPNTATVTMNNASFNVEGNYVLQLPYNTDIVIVVEGENSLQSTTNVINHESGSTTIQGDGLLNIISLDGRGISTNNNGALTITGDVTVNVILNLGESFQIVIPQDIFSDGVLTISGNANVVTSGSNINLYSNNDIIINTNGTIDATLIQVEGDFFYTKGIVSGSWVIEGKGSIHNNGVNSIYGNVDMTKNQTIRSEVNQDGMFITTGSTLTIQQGSILTIESGATLTNSGTIVNNGTIALPQGTTNEQILAMKITGTGTITVDGNLIGLVNGVIYPYGGDISTTGINLTVSAPSIATYYKAGTGYVVWNPVTASVTLHSAGFTTSEAKPTIRLPELDVVLKLEGTSTMTNLYGVAPSGEPYVSAIQMGTLNNIVDITGAIEAKNYKLTVFGEGTLVINSDAQSSIFTDGTFVMKGGTIKSTDKNFDLKTTDFNMDGGTLLLYGNLTIYGNANITGGSVTTPGGDIGVTLCAGNFNMSGGTVTCGTSQIGGMILVGKMIQTGGTVSVITLTPLSDGMTTSMTTSMTASMTVYGDVSLLRYDRDGFIDSSYSSGILIGSTNYYNFKLNIPENAKLTIPQGSELRVLLPTDKKASDFIINNGILVNNGEIILPNLSTTDEAMVLGVITSLKPSGVGIVYVNADEKYANSGVKMISYDYTIDLSNDYGDPIDAPGLLYTGNDQDGYILTLTNVILENGIKLPSGIPITIQTNSTAIIGSVSFEDGQACNITFAGSGAININGDISSCYNGDIVNVMGGTQMIVNGRIVIGGSGGQEGTLNVSGSKTALSVTAEQGSAVYCDTVNVTDGSSLTVSAQSCGVVAQKGGITIKGGSMLTAGCQYGVYVIDGKLTVEDTSKLITNASIAAFCVVDKSKNKEQSEMVSLPQIPSGMEIKSITGTSSLYGATYWSLIQTGGVLSVTNENYEVATLSGAVNGPITIAFVKAADISGNGTTNNGTTTNSGSTNNSGATTNNEVSSNSGTTTNTSKNEENSGAEVTAYYVGDNSSMRSDTVTKTGDANHLLLSVGMFSLLTMIGAMLLRRKNKKSLTD